VSEPSTDLAPLASNDLDRVARLGMWLAAAESKSEDPKAKGMAAALRIAYAEHLGLPAHAAQDIHVIDGGLQLSSRLKRALAHNHGLRVELVSEDETQCTAQIVEIATGKPVGQPVTYTLEMAKRAGTGGRTNWQKHPDQMLWARASARALDRYAPWVTVGVTSLADVDAAALAAQGDLEGEPFEVIDQ
jgi:hypothetical protein